MNISKIFARAVENWPAKVLSIALAMVLFVFHRMGSLTERFFSVPLVMERQTTLVPASSYPRTIRITLRGDANSIYPIQEEDIQAFVDLSKFNSPGSYQTAVQIRKAGAALDVSPLEISLDPGEISLSLDHKISKFVPLKAVIQGEVESGYVMNSYSLDPTQIIIDGPSRLVGNVSELSTNVIDVTGRTGDFSQTVNILNQDPLLVIRGSGVTEFRGFINRIVTVRNFQQVPVRMVALDERFSGELEMQTVSVHLEGRTQEELDNFVLPDNFLWVDCSAVTETGTYVLEIRGEVPPNITLAASPPEMTVYITLPEEDEE